MKKQVIFFLVALLALNSCGVPLETLVEKNSRKDQTTGQYVFQNFNFTQDYKRTRYFYTSKSDIEIRKWFVEKKPDYTYTETKLNKHGQVEYIYFIKNGDNIEYQKKLKQKACQDAITDAHRGMPSPNLSRKNIENAILQCKECCNDELEYSFYKDVPYLKREVYLEYFPNSKYVSKIKQDIADLQGGRKKEVGMFDALGQAYNNSAVGQSIKEIGKSLPVSNSETNNSNSSNYEIIEQVNVKRFEFTNEAGQPNGSSLNLSIGCNDYSHQYNQESTKFNVYYISGDKEYTTHTDIASFNDEISNKYFNQQEGAFVTIIFYNKDNKFVKLKLKFKNGGYYRLEIYPN